MKAIALILALVAGTATAVDASGPGDGGYRVIRFDGTITDDHRAALVATGADIVDYEPRDAYLVWATDREARAAARLPGVQEVAAVPIARKLGPGIPDGPGAIPFAVGVHPSSAPAPGSEIRSDGLVAAGVRSLTPAGARALAADPRVLYVWPAPRRPRPLDEATDQVVAGNLNPSETAPVTGYRAWLGEGGLSGDGVRVAISDGGISSLHPDLDDRVVARHDYTGWHPLAAEGLGRDEGGHGTHVAGIVAGAPSSPEVEDRDGFALGLGMAPGADLVDQKVFGQISSGFPSLTTLAEDAHAAGAAIMNASWAYFEFDAGYGPLLREADLLARDASPEPGDQGFLWVFAGGNFGEDGPPVPQEAKNLLAVGATWSGRPDPVPDPLSGSQGIDDIWDGSSVGPTGDDRVYPTVVAPGGRVISARSPEGLTSCIGPPVPGAALYTFCSGTSMAAPHVSGAAALIHEWWLRERAPGPSPAMVKALLVGSATDLGDADVPNDQEGWGRVNLSPLLAAMPDPAVDQTVVLGGAGETATYEVASDGTVPLRVTLAWTDAPAAVGASPALVNDLDLVVERLGPGDEVQGRWLGNVLADGRSVEGGTADRLNNIENVFLAAPAAGRYRLTVAAANVPGDGVPERPDPTDQDFALVVRGASAGSS